MHNGSASNLIGEVTLGAVYATTILTGTAIAARILVGKSPPIHHLPYANSYFPSLTRTRITRIGIVRWPAIPPYPGHFCPGVCDRIPLAFHLSSAPAQKLVIWHGIS